MSRNTDPHAVVVSFRQVSNTDVVHAPVAMLRLSTFSGILELAELPPTSTGIGGEVEQEMLCIVTWEEYLPKRGAARVKVSGDWRIERNYTGKVVDVLGRPGEH